jgi:serine/threonine-protein kinase HipA
MTSEGGIAQPAEAYVWVWLPGATEPVVAGRIEADGDIVSFNYGRSYLNRSGAIPLYLPELPLRPGRIRPEPGLRVAGCINDAGPDSWGQRIILARLRGPLTRDSDPADLGLITYLLQSGSDRIGGLDFQLSADNYEPRSGSATLDEMIRAADLVEAGEVLSPELDAALLHGSSIGGARPKVLLDDNERKLIAKLSSRSDPYAVVKAEGVAMELARRVGLAVPNTEVTRALNHDVLLVDRFDRTLVAGERKLMVSALTMLNLDELMGRYATYPDLADLIRARFTEPAQTLRELFSRIVFNICVGNIDDHARNHAAFWDGETLTLTPAYDLCPQLRSGTSASQLMAIGRDGSRDSQFRVCIAAADVYLLSTTEAREIIAHQVDVIESQWNGAADAARLTEADQTQLWRRQILNPYAFEDYH